MPLRYRAPRPAERFQRPDDPIRLITRRHRPIIARAIGDALKSWRRLVDRKAIAADIRARNFRGAAERVDVDGLKERVRAAFQTIAACYHEAAQHGAKRVNADLKAARGRLVAKAPPQPGAPAAPTSASDPFAFDLFSQQVLQDLGDAQAALLDDLTGDAQQTIYDAVIAGVRLGQEPEEVADSIRDVIGLDERMAQAVENYRAALENASSGALDRALRDDSEDAAVQAAIDAGVPLSDDVINDLVDAYTENALDYRADTIARTESSRAANAGLQDAYGQAIDRDVMPDDAVRQFWMIAAGDREEDECDECADNAPDGIAIGESFTCSDGDFDAPPEHVRCQCSIEVRTDLDILAAWQRDNARQDNLEDLTT